MGIVFVDGTTTNKGKEEREREKNGPEKSGEMLERVNQEEEKKGEKGREKERKRTKAQRQWAVVMLLERGRGGLRSELGRRIKN